MAHLALHLIDECWLPLLFGLVKFKKTETWKKTDLIVNIILISCIWLPWVNVQMLLWMWIDLYTFGFKASGGSAELDAVRAAVRAQRDGLVQREVPGLGREEEGGVVWTWGHQGGQKKKKTHSCGGALPVKSLASCIFFFILHCRLILKTSIIWARCVIMQPAKHVR